MNMRILQGTFYIKDWNTFDSVKEMVQYRQAQGIAF